MKIIIILLSFCFLIRLAFFFAVKPWNPDYTTQKFSLSDAPFYHNIAKNILEKAHFSYESPVPIDAYRTPLYPLFISFFYSIFGEKPWVVLIFQILLNTVSCFFILVTIRRFLNEKIAIASGIFYVLDPFLILYCSVLVSEILFVFLCILSFYYLSLFLENRKMQFLFFAGLFIGMATLTKPIAQFLPILIVIFLLAMLRNNFKSAIKNLVVYLLIFFITVSPWIIRNYFNFGSFFISTSGPLNLLVEYASPIVSVKKGVDRNTAQDLVFEEANNLMLRENINPSKIDDFQKAKYWGGVAISYIKRNPGLFIKFYTLGIMHSLGNLETNMYSGMLGLERTQVRIKEYTSLFELIKAFIQKKSVHEIMIGVIIATFLVISYLLLIIGFCVSWPRYPKPFLLLCTLMASYFILITGAAGVARFRLPSIPFYLVFIGIGLNYIIERMRSREQKQP